MTTRSQVVGPTAVRPAGAGHARGPGPGRLGARGEADPRALCLHHRPDLGHGGPHRCRGPSSTSSTAGPTDARSATRCGRWSRSRDIPGIPGAARLAQLSGSEDGGSAALGKKGLDGLRPLLRDEHGSSRARGLVSLLPAQWLENTVCPAMIRARSITSWSTGLWSKATLIYSMPR